MVMFAFLTDEPAVVPDGFQGDVAGAVQLPPSGVRPHPTVMHILNDAGVAEYPLAEVEAGLAADQITMTCHRIGVPCVRARLRQPITPS